MNNDNPFSNKIFNKTLKIVYDKMYINHFKNAKTINFYTFFNL